jgi:hypothetical protein
MLHREARRPRQAPSFRRLERAFLRVGRAQEGPLISATGREIVNTVWRAMTPSCLRMIAAALVTIASASTGLACKSDALIDPAIAALTTKTTDACTIKVERGPDDAVRITIRGRSFDGRRLLKGVLSATNDQATAGILGASWDIEVARLKGFNDEELRDVVFRLERRSGDITGLSLTANLGGADLTGQLQAQDDSHQRIAIATANAGAFLRWIDAYPQFLGGTMSLTLKASADDVRGTLKIEKSALAKGSMLQSMSIFLPPGRGHHRSFRLQISRLRLDFAHSSAPSGLTVSNGILFGPDVGATIEGTFDVSQGLNLAGTIVPVAINNSPIPLLMPQLLHGEGLFCMTYRLTGPPSAPKLQINPIGIATPGLLRRLFAADP